MINIIEKSLVKLTKSKGKKTQVNKLRNENGDVTTDTNETESQ